MRKITVIFAMLFCLASYGQLGTNITNRFVTAKNWDEANQGVFTGITLGACEAQVGVEVPIETLFTDFKHYYVDTDVLGADFIMDFDITFYNCKVTIIGSNDLVVNSEEGYTITIGSDLCGNVAEVVSDNDEGRLYVSVADYVEAQETLSTISIIEEVKNGGLPNDMQFELYDVLGKSVLKGNTNNYSISRFKQEYDGFYILSINDGIVNVNIKQVF